MPDIHDVFRVSEHYSNDEIYKSLKVGNAGGVRVKKSASGDIERIVVFTSLPSARQLAENPYHDRIEGNVLIYTGAGKEGDQTASGVNARIAQQRNSLFPIYGFVQIAGRPRGEAGLLELALAFEEANDSRNSWLRPRLTQPKL